MTLLLAFSDTHGDISSAEKIVKLYPQAAKILHLGDFVSDSIILKKLFPDKDVLAVNGNCDGFVHRETIPDERILDIEGKKILMVHGHRFGVKSELERLAKYAKQKEADLVLFGHTHIPVDVEKLGIHLLNPGSPSYPNGIGYPSYALIEVGHGMIETRVMDID